MSMQAIRLEYVASARPSLPGVALMLVALVVAALAWQQHSSLNQQRQSLAAAILQARQAAGLQQALQRAPVRSSPALAADMLAARQVADFLLMPWDDVFTALEAASINDAALLSIEPDAKKQQLKLLAEAKDKDAMFRYMQRLEATPQLADVVLLKHEILEDQAQHPIRFVLSAQWEANWNTSLKKKWKETP